MDVGQHVFGLLYDGELSLAPTSSLKRVLDVGAGSGKWAMDMGVVGFLYLTLNNFEEVEVADSDTDLTQHVPRCNDHWLVLSLDT